MAEGVCTKCGKTGECVHKFVNSSGSNMLYVIFVCLHCIYEVQGFVESDWKGDSQCPFCKQVLAEKT